MKLSHNEKQKYRKELRLKGFPPEVVERELRKKLSMDENTPVEPEVTPEVVPENEPVAPEAPIDTPEEPVA